jgi:colicin import membrane protein
MYSQADIKDYSWRPIISGAVLCLLCSMVNAQDAVDIDALVKPGKSKSEFQVLVDRYPAGSITTQEIANRAGEDIHKMHGMTNTQFANDQKTCYQKFFATDCLSDAKERHRKANEQVARVEVEANKFKRRTNAVKREKQLADKRDKETAEAKEVNTLQNQPSNRVAEYGGTLYDSKENSVTPQAQPVQAEKKVTPQKRKKSPEKADSQKHAENISAHERKVRDAEARQKRLAAKKAEKERKQLNKETAVSK